MRRGHPGTTTTAFWQGLAVLLFFVLPCIALAATTTCESLKGVDKRYPHPLVCVSDIGLTCGAHGTFAGPCSCTCACDNGWGGQFCNISISNVGPTSPQRSKSPFGFARTIARRGVFHQLGPVSLKADDPSRPVQPLWMFPDERNRPALDNTRVMFEYTWEMWVMPIFNESAVTNNTGFTLWELRMNDANKFIYEYSGGTGGRTAEGYARCWSPTALAAPIPYCDPRRMGIFYTFGGGWGINYYRTVDDTVPYNFMSYSIPFRSPTTDPERIRLKSGEPIHIAFAFEAVKGGQLGPSNYLDDQTFYLYVNGMLVEQGMMYDRRFADDWDWYFGSWAGSFPNGTYTFINSIGDPVAMDTAAVDALLVDEVRVWVGGRNQKQILDNMFHPVAPNEPNLMWYWNFDEAMQDKVVNTATLPDQSGYNYNYTFNFNNGAFDKYFGNQSLDEAFFPLFEESFVPTGFDWDKVAPRRERLYLDAGVGEIVWPEIIFGATTRRIGDYMYYYGGARYFPFVGTPSGIAEMRLYNIKSQRWSLPPVVGPAPDVFEAAAVVDGTKIWYFGGSTDIAHLCYLETLGIALQFTCPSSPTWSNLVSPRLGMTSVKIGRKVFLFGGAVQFGSNFLAIDDLIEFDLDTLETVLYTKPVATGESVGWPAARFLACAAPYGQDKFMLYGGITGFEDKGTLRELWLFDSAGISSASFWSPVPIPAIKFQSVSAWASCSYTPNTMISYAGTTGLGVAETFFKTQRDQIPRSIKNNAISILRMNLTDPASSEFELMSPLTYDFAGAPKPIRMGHSAVVSQDGSHLVVVAGFCLDQKAEGGIEMFGDRRTHMIRLGCPDGYLPGTSNLTDLFSADCTPCPAGTYQPIGYPRDIYSVSCLPCPVNTYSLGGASYCTFCPQNTSSTLEGLTSADACTPCATGYYTVSAGSPCVVLENQGGLAPWAIAIVVIVVVVAVLAAIVAILFVRRLRERKKKLEKEQARQIDIDESQFNFVFLKASDIEFGDELGSGSFGTVFKGVYKGRPVAIKVSRPGVEEALKDFLREAEVMMRIEPHPNVIQLIGVALSGGSALVLLEFVDGGSLDRLLAKGHQFQSDELPGFLKEIVSGLDHIHKHNLIHRDLAARNILLSKDPATGRYIPKIADFGMSRVVEESEKQQGQTKTNFGPVPWMAPEAIGELQYSPQSDIWSLGVTIWEIVSGLDPAQQMELIDLAVLIRDKGYHPIIPPFIPQYLVDIMEGCWKMAPASRMPLSQILTILASAISTSSFAPPVVVTNRGGKKADRQTKVLSDKGDNTAITAEAQKLKQRLQQLERDIAAVLAENDEFEKLLSGGGSAGSPSVKPPKKENKWRTSIKPSAMTNTIGPRDEIEMTELGRTHQPHVVEPDTGTYSTVNFDVAQPSSADSPYTSLPASATESAQINTHGQGYSELAPSDDGGPVSPRSRKKRKGKGKKKQ